MEVLLAGNGALRTVKLEAAQYIVLDDSRKVKSGFLP